MSKIIEIVSQPWMGTFFGILGIVAASYFYRKSRYISKLAYQHEDVTLLGEADAAFPDEVKILFDGKDVPRVTSNKVILWNAGNTTIGASQLVASDPFRIELKEKSSSILKVRIINKTREVNGFRVHEQKDEMFKRELHFDFLDPNDGVVFEIIHSGGRKDLDIKGTIKGIPSGIGDLGIIYSTKRSKGIYPFENINKVMVVAALIGFCMILYGIFKPNIVELFPQLISTPKPDDPTKISWAPVVTGLAYTIMPLMLLWIKRKRYPAVLDDVQEEKSEQGT